MANRSQLIAIFVGLVVFAFHDDDALHVDVEQGFGVVFVEDTSSGSSTRHTWSDALAYRQPRMPEQQPLALPAPIDPMLLDRR